jgi:hypothetical protein
MTDFLGIARERIFSPGKVDADRLILEAVADALRHRGHEVRLVSAEDPLPAPTRGTTVFTMSQGASALATLREWERNDVRVINSVDSILNSHRHRLLDRFEHARVKDPEAILLSTGTAGPGPWPEWLETDGGWLKRGDVHATEAGDVVFVRSATTATHALAEFCARGIASAVLQRHVEGVVIKFYGVADGFLAWYPVSEARLALAAHQATALELLAHAGARALGLEVYGGDCIAGPDGALWLIDLNDWPSFAPCRAAGAESIACRLEALSEPSHP